jgi:TonB-dependent SusC/RagA subfamily outer membrane receptor
VSANKTNISQIRKYLNGELDARAMHELEHQALNDPFLADALEGYERRGDQHHNLADLQKRLQHRTAPAKRRISLWPTISIAASVLLFVAVGGWWLVSNRSAVTQKELAATDKTIVKTQPLMPAVKAPAPPVRDSAVLKPASPNNLIIAGNRKSSIQQKSFSGRYASPPSAAMAAAEPQAESTPAKPQEVQADEAVAYSPRLAQRLVRDKRADANGLLGNSPDIRIRGLRSVGGKEPLYVVDGKIYNGKLADFNTKDIENIFVLKDASSTAIYGSRGANGVILITTKPGSMARLKSDSSALNKNMLAEVVVVGYPVQYKRDVTASVSSVKPVQIEQALQGTLAGVQVSKNVKRQKLADTLRTITGQVLAKDDGQPLPGVSIAVAGKNERTQTDANGRFKIKALPGDELNLAYIGFETKRLKVNKQDSLNITLKQNESALSEVVVIGYGASKDEAATARPQNGWSEFNQYLKENAKPVNGKTGVVRLSFVVNADHTLSDFKILKNLSPEADKAAIKLIEDGPVWLPNTNAKPQTVKLRIRFEL